MKLIILAIFLKGVLQILYNVYLFQLKEYRLDRYFEHLSRRFSSPITRLLHITLAAPVSRYKLPKPTPKAILVLLISLIVEFLFFPQLALLSLLLSPLVVIFSIYLIAPFEWIVRKYHYEKARIRIDQLKSKGLRVIGISGSYGKTSTKIFTEHILSMKYSVLSTQRSINTPYAISRIILNRLNETHDFFIVEMGAYKIGEIKEMVDIAQPDIGILTGISNQHIALFGSQDNIITAKSELLAGVKRAYVNGDSKHKPIISGGLDVSYYGKHLLKKYAQELSGATIPEFLLINTLPGILIARELKINTRGIQAAIKSVKTPKKIMNISIGYKGAIVIDDSFSSNEEGVLAALDHLSQQKNKNKVLIMSSLIELDKNSAKQAHVKINKFIDQHNISSIITSRDYYKDLGGGKNKNISFVRNPDGVIKKLRKTIDKDSVILIEGRVSSKIINFLKHE